MKSIIRIEVETPDTQKIFPSDGETEEDYKGREKELEAAREVYAEEIHGAVVRRIKNIEEDMGERFLEEEGEELYIESWDELKDYGIKIKIIEELNDKKVKN